MTISRLARHVPAGLLVALVLGLPGIAAAWQSDTRPLIRPAPPGVQFQQAAQQQEARDQLQQGLLEQQLHQGVSDNAKRPSAGNPRQQRQLEQADQAQRDRDRARLQDLLDRERDAPTPPRVVPQTSPVPKQDGG